MTSGPTRFDPVRIQAFAGGDRALAAELTALFIRNAALYAASYKAASDVSGRAALLHKLKGAALTVGAERLAALCAAGEEDLAADIAIGLEEEIAALRRELNIQ